MLTEWWSDLRYRLRAVFHRADLERELAAGIHDHLKREAESYRLAGLSQAEDVARR
jgi:putative ABC transport system permease protein